MRCFGIICLALTMGAGCSGDGGDLRACDLPIPTCVVANGPAEGGFTPCSDVAEAAVCLGGPWGCPTGTVPMEQCACHIRADAAEYCNGDAGPF